MCDTETFSDNLEQLPNPNSGRRFQKSDALWSLAFWSHPAWIHSANDSLCNMAVTQWVVYHRTTVALSHLIPIAQVIGSVRGVIPDSKLAKYGDYSYDIDYEDMCYITEDASTRCHVAQLSQSVGAGRRNIWAMDAFDAKTQRELVTDPEPNETQRSLDEWLEKLKRALESVRQIAHEADLLDSWTETLLKISLRLICATRINYALVELLNKDVSLINDYEELQKTPVSEIELQSIPQPERDCGLDKQLTDALWMKLSSSEVRKFWKDDARHPSSFYTKGCNLLPLMKINFLRHSRPKNFDSSEQSVEIPQNMEVELLGSLLQFIEETPMQSEAASRATEIAPRNHFPEAHGDWTQLLFPRRNFERDRRAALTVQFTDLASKAEPCNVETRMMPLRFYMSVPPPPLATAVCMPPSPRPLSYAYCHPRNGLIYSSLPQQVHLKVPVAQIQPTMFASTPAISANCNVPQRLTAPRQVLVAGQFQRMNEPRGSYQLLHPKDVQKCQLKIVEPSFNVGTQQNDEIIAKEGEPIYRGAEVPHDNPWMANKPFAQCNPPVTLPQNGGSTARNRSILPPMAKHTNAYGLKLNSQPPVREARSASYPIASYRLPPPVIPLASPLRNHCIQPQFHFKPRFLGAITINDIKRLQERSFLHKCGEMNSSLYQDAQKSVSIENLPLNRKDRSVGYEDKVEQWLETVNQYVASGSFINIEELPESPRGVVTSKLDACGKGDGAELEEWCSQNTTRDFQSKHIYCQTKVPSNRMDERYLGNGVSTFMKRERKNARKILLKQLQLLRNYLLKHKNGRGLERKITVMEKCLAEVNFSNNDLVYWKRIVRSFKRKKFSRYLHKYQKRREYDLKKDSFSIGMKSNSKPPQPESYFDMQKDKMDDFLINDAFDFKIRIRESHEFNTFPSKRMKLGNSISLFCDEGVWVRDELTRKICSLNYFDAAIDELFFSPSQIKELNEKLASPERISGWTHLKIAIKTVMTNLINSLENLQTNNQN